jgi:hypothetical protein
MQNKEIKREEIEKNQKHKYMMLSRLKFDVDAFLGYDFVNVNRLYYKDIDKHIEEMRKLYKEIVIKPEWITAEQIEEYNKQMTLKVEGENTMTIEEQRAQIEQEKQARKEAIRPHQNKRVIEELEALKEGDIATFIKGSEELKIIKHFGDSFSVYGEHEDHPLENIKEDLINNNYVWFNTFKKGVK